MKSVNLDFKVVNVVATAALDHDVNLDSISSRFPCEVEHDPEKYRGRVAYFKSNDMDGKVSIFQSGKLISVGTKSIEKAKQELTLISKTLKIGLKKKPTVQNIVATANLGFKVNLEDIIQLEGINAIYEPEQFPAMMINLPLSGGKKTTILLFASGKLVCVGLKNLEDIHQAKTQFLKILHSHTLHE